MTATKRKPDTGLVRPYRKKPDNFREVYIRMGWDGIEEELNANWRCIRRWIDEEGREELAAARAAHVAEKRQRARRYVLGRTMTAVQPRPVAAIGDAA